eukprot:CAMPEP_0168346734 /NCGR_PEP_ID=MMETSP0213-20121227/18498_1 /TAXON_ID=151035 /ORGANISM="Euplotes harpa, Strain FSP1.4" /LENGTH=54 /DNA_ID=CAMNT_0008355543 /DNA_START=75 /DNA_END=236 /DNA_ORIENTATION=-
MRLLPGGPPEAWVVRVDRHGDASLQEGPRRVPSQVVSVAEDEIADWAYFNTNSF